MSKKMYATTMVKKWNTAVTILGQTYPVNATSAGFIEVYKTLKALRKDHGKNAKYIKLTKGKNND